MFYEHAILKSLRNQWFRKDFDMRARRPRACAPHGIFCKGFVKKCYVEQEDVPAWYDLTGMVGGAESGIGWHGMNSYAKCMCEQNHM